MSASLISLLALAAIVAGAIAGALLGKLLPEHHLSNDSKDIVKFGSGFIATLAALVLGLLVASAKSSFDAKAAEVEASAAKVILLDQALRQYGADAKPARDVLRSVLVSANDEQRALKERSLQVVDDFMQTKWLFVAQSTEGVSTPLLVVLVVWLATIAFCTGLYAPRNATVAMVGLLCAASAAGAIFVIVEMYQPFDGILRISDAPLRAALGYLGN